MRIEKDQVISFMLTMGLMQDQASQIHGRAQRGNNHTEELLNALYPANVLLPGTSEYSDLINNYFGSRPRLNAAAIFVPTSTEQVASGLKVLEFFQRQFAIKGLGYTSHPGMAGIEDGVLVALENMNEIRLSSSGNLVSIGPGNSWGRVYEALQAEGVAVPGGELAVVGVAGLLTGNGMGPFLGSRGFSSADVANFEVVTAGGKVINANATDNSDLWWALKGGSNNFGIVTRFDMNTFPLRDGVWSGTLSYSASQADVALGLLYEMQVGPLLEDPHLTVTCMETLIPSYDVALVDLAGFTDRLNFTGTHPAAIRPLIDAGPISANMSRKTLIESATESITPEFLGVYTARINRANINVKADRELYQEISALLFSHYQNSTLEEHTIGLSFNPVTPHAVRESSRKGGNPGGWKEVNQNSINLRTNWADAADDAAAVRMDDEFMKKATDLAQRRGALMPNQWLNNAAENAGVMRSYGEDNFQRLRSVADRYDEPKTFQNLCPGGYKLAA
ncbi:mitomycin radical oxidase [Colletotrichum sojae]|uniref:Mitomycin radical oxidase n=1 Tax=Colletotrichum sojae TaxID=2175907 RepID=A0A8H6JBC9_9PEZI|nr:mitomycin radical oxidase [Colletotrichum sojae]